MEPIMLTRRALNAAFVSGFALGPLAHAATQPSGASQRLAKLADDYYRGKFDLNPLDATENAGEAEWEARLTIDIGPAHRQREREFYRRTLARAGAIDRDALAPGERVTLDLIAYDAQDSLAVSEASLRYLFPVDHMNGLPVRLAQWAGGKGSQPMATAAHYEHFLQRLRHLPQWIDQAVANMREGMRSGVVMPRALVERTVPQLRALTPASVDASPYLAGVGDFPEGVPPKDRAALRSKYREAVERSIAPAVRRLADFMGGPYLAAARSTAGLGELPGGAQWYRAAVASSTTLDVDPARVHELGLREVARIRGEMEEVQRRFGFAGSLEAFLDSLDSRPELTPFRSEDEIVAAFRALNGRLQERLPRLFERAPKAPLEVRAIEPARRDTASSYYVPPALDGSRPGVFFAAVPDPRKFQATTMTSLFLHEGQPGHHYQMALQREVAQGKLRQSTWYDAYGEGWALYAESLGGELGVYDTPASQLGRLQMELFRASRLVVDTGLHAQGWSREQGIDYAHRSGGLQTDDARREVERYMAWPGQALAYKTGELKIIELRERARRAMGAQFDLRRFHTQVLSDGCLPLAMLEAKMDGWVAAHKA